MYFDEDDMSFCVQYVGYLADRGDDYSGWKAWTFALMYHGVNRAEEWLVKRYLP